MMVDPHLDARPSWSVLRLQVMAIIGERSR